MTKGTSWLGVGRVTPGRPAESFFWKKDSNRRESQGVQAQGWPQPRGRTDIREDRAGHGGIPTQKETPALLVSVSVGGTCGVPAPCAVTPTNEN